LKDAKQLKEMREQLEAAEDRVWQMQEEQNAELEAMVAHVREKEDSRYKAITETSP